jgi:photosystem II stability/assembly factor-like uncharacterized protein
MDRTRVLFLAMTFVGSVVSAASTEAGHNPSNIRALAVHSLTPTTVYAGTDGGVLKSTDGGTTWRTSGLADKHIGTVLIDPLTPSRLYASRFDIPGFFKSADGGATWREITTSPAPGPPFAIDPLSPNTLYAGDSSGMGGILRSIDGGETWRSLEFIDGVGSLVIDPNTSAIYAGTWWNGIWVSRDSGATWSPTGSDWSQISQMSPTTALAVDPVNSLALYAGIGTQCCALDGTDHGGGGVFKSLDSGTTWFVTGLANSSDPWSFSTVQSLAADATNVYAVRDSVFYKSGDGGDTWRAIWLVSDRFLAVQAIALDRSTPATTIYAGTVIGVFKSTDGGESWRAAGMPDPAPPAGPLTLSLTSPTGNTILTGSFNVSWTYTGGAAPIGVRVEARSLNGWSTTPLGTIEPASTPGSLTLNARNMMQGLQLLVVTAWGATGASSQVTREITVWYSDVTPPDTAITAAVDSSGATLPNGGVTLAKAITITATSRDDTMVARLECRLDGAAFTTCTSPIAYSNLSVGSHTVEVRAVDQAGNVEDTRRASLSSSTPRRTLRSRVLSTVVEGRSGMAKAYGLTPSRSASREPTTAPLCDSSAGSMARRLRRVRVPSRMGL